MFHTLPVDVSLRVSKRATGPVRRVLLAGVDVQLRAELAAALRAARLDVIEVANGFAAFRSYMRLQGEVDLVVAPLHMDEHDGLALARGLATLAPRLPVLLLGGDHHADSAPMPPTCASCARARRIRSCCSTRAWRWPAEPLSLAGSRHACVG